MKCINNRLSFSINRHFLLLSALREPKHQIYGRSIGLLSEVALQLPISYNINVSGGQAYPGPRLPLPVFDQCSSAVHSI